MRLLTKQMLVNVVAERWYSTYFRDGKWYDEAKKNLYENLHDLNPPNADDINSIIGNKSWTILVCSSCNGDPEEVAVVDVTGGEYSTHICRPCLKKMLGLFEVGEIPF